jgi:hypothetical protein
MIADLETQQVVAILIDRLAFPVDTIGVLRELQPGLREREPERLVAFVRVGVRALQTVVRMRAVLLDGTHGTFPDPRLPIDNHHPTWAKSGAEWGAGMAI